jgi:hypothetical protein
MPTLKLPYEKSQSLRYGLKTVLSKIAIPLSKYERRHYKAEDIAKKTGFSVNTIYDYLSSAVKYGILHHVNKNGYRITPLFDEVMEGNFDSIYVAISSPDIFKPFFEHYSRYSEYSVESLTGLLMNTYKNIQLRPAGKLSVVFIENVKYINDIQKNKTSFKQMKSHVPIKRIPKGKIEPEGIRREDDLVIISLEDGSIITIKSENSSKSVLENGIKLIEKLLG